MESLASRRCAQIFLALSAVAPSGSLVFLTRNTTWHSATRSPATEQSICSIRTATVLVERHLRAGRAKELQPARENQKRKSDGNVRVKS